MHQQRCLAQLPQQQRHSTRQHAPLVMPIDAVVCRVAAGGGGAALLQWVQLEGRVARLLRGQLHARPRLHPARRRRVGWARRARLRSQRQRRRAHRQRAGGCRVTDARTAAAGRPRRRGAAQGPARGGHLQVALLRDGPVGAHPSDVDVPGERANRGWAACVVVDRSVALHARLYN